uniref:F-box domain-containing protein n=2 Tax=Denticeps clupeoides TaxID=299321 RepID=A0A8C4FZP0_9TELE
MCKGGLWQELPEEEACKPGHTIQTHNMQLTELNRECLLHLFSFLDKDSRLSLSLTCHWLRDVFLEPRLWSLLRFRSPGELLRDNFVLGPSLRHLAVCWHSSRVKVCNIEDWMKSSFQKDLCRKHKNVVSAFLARVCHVCPNLLSLTLSGCGHVTDHDIVSLLQRCGRLRRLCLENCSRLTDSTLQAVVTHGHGLAEDAWGLQIKPTCSCRGPPTTTTTFISYIAQNHIQYVLMCFDRPYS